MTQPLLVGLASIVVLGVSAQWLAWRFRVPSILLLLLFALVAGPVTGLLRPDAMLGDLLFPLVSLSVAIILFEGALNLRVIELHDIGGVLRNLITVGTLVTWGLATIAAIGILELDADLAGLFGAMLVVSGPTVVGPLLRHVRPVGRLYSTLKWEGILIDPIGVLLSVLVFEVILVREFHTALTLVLSGVAKTVVVGGGLGFLSARLLVRLLQRYWIPDYLQNPVVLMLVLGIFTITNLVQGESGLFAVTVMGITLANQKTVSIRHIITFKEVLQVLLISGLFILLTARLRLADLEHLGLASLGFLGVLIVIVRPVAVAVSTWGSGMTWRERVFLAWVAPRGIVAASVASIFALRLSQVGYTQAAQLAPLTFLVIAGTAAVYGLTAAPVARWLGVAQRHPQGVLFVGAFPVARAMARALQREGFRTLLIDTNWNNIVAARLEGLSAHHGSAVREETLDELDLDGIGRLVALTSNDEANALAALHFAELFGRSEVYQLVPRESGDHRAFAASRLWGRLLFGSSVTHAYLTRQIASGAEVKTTRLSERFTYEDFQALYGKAAIPLFLIPEAGHLRVCTLDTERTPEPGQSLISLILPQAKTSQEASRSEVRQS